MGKVLSKKRDKVTEIELSDYQNEVLYKCYCHLSYHTNGLKQEGVADFLSKYIDEEFAVKISELLMFGSGTTLTLKRLKEFFVIAVYASPTLRLNFIKMLLDDDTKESFQKILIKMLKSFWKLNRKMENERLYSWRKNVPGNNFDIVSDEKLTLLVDSIISDYNKNYDLWILYNSMFSEIFQHIFRNLLQICNEVYDERTQYRPVLPYCQCNIDEKFSTILNMSDILFLSSHINPRLREEWQLLYCDQIHGPYISEMFNNILHKENTLIVVQDTDGHKFGAFTSTPWQYSANFYGFSDCFMFQLWPTMDKLLPTDINRNYMYLNRNQDKLPNGLAIGGQLNYFGLHLFDKFGKGRSNPSCTTFQSYKPMSKSIDFDYRSLEVWHLGLPDDPLIDSNFFDTFLTIILFKNKEAKPKNGILSRNSEDMTLLKM